MSRLRHLDILVELIELCHERMGDVRQQLIYYRASVYKQETSTQIAGKVEQLRLVARLFGDLMVQEAFSDYETSSTGAINLAPGECPFSLRVTTLLLTLEHHMIRIGQETLSRNASPEIEAALTTAVKEHRTQLLALCREGSRQWAFFQSF